MKQLDEAIMHLKIIHVWAEFALEHGDFILTTTMLKSITDWTMEIVRMMEGQHDR